MRQCGGDEGQMAKDQGQRKGKGRNRKGKERKRKRKRKKKKASRTHRMGGTRLIPKVIEHNDADASAQTQAGPERERISLDELIS